MPTNLPPEALKAEARYRAAQTVPEQIAALEEYIRLIPKHKGTDKLRAGLRKRLSKLQSSPKATKGLSHHESAFHIDREGAGQVVVVGAPNVGKSALVVALTNASPAVSESPFTTWEPTPGMMHFEDVPIQLVDTPPLHVDCAEGDLYDLVRRADMVLLVVDLLADPVRQLEQSVVLLAERHIRPIHAEDPDAEFDRRIAVAPWLIVANKCDDADGEELFELFGELVEDDWPMVAVSAATGHNLDELKRRVFVALDVIRIYSKPPGKDPDLDAPFVVERGCTLEEFAGHVHRDFYEQLKSARVWGGSADHDGQMVGRDHVLEDKDIVELRI